MGWIENLMFLSVMFACLLNAIDTAKVKMDLRELERKVSMHEYEHFREEKEEQT